ncbi:MAG: ATP synthase F0 subunit B [Acidobacteria bacterium]|nr:MAG: ATP synthase F0 subunit B [Acidobacteriota bacterium]
MSETTRRAFLASALTALAASPAFAAGGGESGGLFAGDLGSAIWTLVIFLALVFVLGKYAWGPILTALQQREDFIRDALAKARDDREQAAAELAKYEEMLAKARAEATAIVEEGRRDAEVLRQRIEASAREEAEKHLARARREINVAKETVVKELYELSGRLATDIASRIIGRELRPEDHRRLIESSIQEIEQRGIN